MDEALARLRERLQEIDDLECAAGLLYWDQSTYMPKAGAPARARQLSTLSRLAHQKFIDPAVGRLLDELAKREAEWPPDSDEAALVRVTRRDYERAVKVPADFMAEFTRHGAETYDAWTRARPANDFQAVAPLLKRTVELSRRYADFFPGYEHIADPLIDATDEGMTVAALRPLFAELREGLAPLVETIASQPPADDACLRGDFAEDRQIAFAVDVVRRFGYDFDRGRLDRTPHPFMIRFSSGDVRITTRVKPGFLGEALFSILHEAGHALYEQGVPARFEGTPLAAGATSGVHESQSRLWENLVGRSRPFWERFFPKLKKAFPDALRDASLDDFYRAINKVERSLIRTDADEVTYNLHVIIRFDLELALLEGRLDVEHLPEAWNEAYRNTLGVAPPDDRDGALQDMHWYNGAVGGAFQCYAIGNVLAAQFFDAATRAAPDIMEDMRRGEFASLLTWLRANVHAHGRALDAKALINRATGRDLSVRPYLDYLQRKYGELYNL